MSRRGGWPLALLVVLLVAIPIVEVWLLIQVGQAIGVWPTVLVLVVEAVLGAALMRREGRRTWQALSEALGRGTVPSGELADAALVLCGGLLLMLPGFATDVLGLVFLLPFTRPLARRLLGFVLARRISRLGVPGGASGARGDVIEGETVETPQPGSGSTVISGEVLDR